MLQKKAVRAVLPATLMTVQHAARPGRERLGGASVAARCIQQRLGGTDCVPDVTDLLPRARVARPGYLGRDPGIPRALLPLPCDSHQPLRSPPRTPVRPCRWPSPSPGTAITASSPSSSATNAQLLCPVSWSVPCKHYSSICVKFMYVSFKSAG